MHSERIFILNSVAGRWSLVVAIIDTLIKQWTSTFNLFYRDTQLHSIFKRRIYIAEAQKQTKHRHSAIESEGTKVDHFRNAGKKIKKREGKNKQTQTQTHKEDTAVFDPCQCLGQSSILGQLFVWLAVAH